MADAYAAAANASNPGRNLPFDASSLPVAQLESLRFKSNQIIESIRALQRLIEGGNQNVMPPWPDILARYNLLLSQTHNFTSSLGAVPPTTTSKQNSATTNNNFSIPANQFSRLALYPSFGMSDTQLDNDLIPLLRNQQTTEVLRLENNTVRRLSEKLAATKGGAPQNEETHNKVLQECQQIQMEHDLRCERAVRAVTMLKEGYDWKVRVAVEQDEGNENPMSPLLPTNPLSPLRMSPIPPLHAGPSQSTDAVLDTPVDTPGDDDDDEEDAELEEVLGPSINRNSPSSPMDAQPI